MKRSLLSICFSMLFISFAFANSDLGDTQTFRQIGYGSRPDCSKIYSSDNRIILRAFLSSLTSTATVVKGKCESETGRRCGITILDLRMLPVDPINNFTHACFVYAEAVPLD